MTFSARNPYPSPESTANDESGAKRKPGPKTGLRYPKQVTVEPEQRSCLTIALLGPCLRENGKAGVLVIPRKEVIQPQVPLRLPCYDLVPVTGLTVGRRLPCGLATDFGCSQLP